MLIAGVGGQGALLFSASLARALGESGLEVVTAETHGMAQRYGRITIHLKYGPQVHGGLIPSGGADVLVGLEPLEALRSLKYCHPSTLVLLNTRSVAPPAVSLSWSQRYPEVDEAVRALSEAAEQVFVADATALAQEAGNALAANAVLLGMLAETGRLPLAAEVLRAAVLARVPPKARAVNEKAFEKGRWWLRAQIQKQAQTQTQTGALRPASKPKPKRRASTAQAAGRRRSPQKQKP